MLLLLLWLLMSHLNEQLLTTLLTCRHLQLRLRHCDWIILPFLFLLHLSLKHGTFPRAPHTHALELIHENLREIGLCSSDIGQERVDCGLVQFNLSQRYVRGIVRRLEDFTHAACIRPQSKRRRQANGSANPLNRVEKAKRTLKNRLHVHAPPHDRA